MFNRRLAIICITLLVSVGSWQTAQAKGGIINKITRYGGNDSYVGRSGVWWYSNPRR